MWKYQGQQRPPFAEEPGPGQESVWDYPRPPACVPDEREVVVAVGSVEIARTRRARRILETASPPTFYLPPDSIVQGVLEPGEGRSWCEWKGAASYWDVVVPGHRVAAAAWSYAAPKSPFDVLAGWIAFYPGRVACTVDGERVRPQPGAFYGGWITDEIVGPFKGGGGGTSGW